jgi:plastocyanin
MNGSQSFSPNPANVRVGQTVAWRNADSLAHTATADSRSFDTGTIGRNATSAPITMSSAGALPYHCALHPSMTGTLNVTQ